MKIKVECLECEKQFPYFKHDNFSSCPACGKKGSLVEIKYGKENT
ncbi:MAG: hypothetical protein PHQ35_09465 [Phycisphaerae bacterium]|nr:hypothetical protein [Phycisphaerae bacterium]MDD5239945.1 hypothetical protein [Candidatus Nanoarchaeia archaeon]